MRSVAIATVPKITLVTGNAAGHAYLAMVILNLHTMQHFYNNNRYIEDLPIYFDGKIKSFNSTL